MRDDFKQSTINYWQIELDGNVVIRNAEERHAVQEQS